MSWKESRWGYFNTDYHCCSGSQPLPMDNHSNGITVIYDYNQRSSRDLLLQCFQVWGNSHSGVHCGAPIIQFPIDTGVGKREVSTTWWAQ